MHKTLLFYTKVQWLSQGKVVAEHLFESRAEIAGFSQNNIFTGKND
jgi:hypothetical protein